MKGILLVVVLHILFSASAFAHIVEPDYCGGIGNPCKNVMCKTDIFEQCPSGLRPAGATKNYQGCGYYWHYQLDFCPQDCMAPYSWDINENRCVKYCPPSAPVLNEELGICVPEDDVIPPEDCTIGNPIAISSGVKIQKEKPDYDEERILPLQFIRIYRSDAAPEADPRFASYFRYPLHLVPDFSDSTWVQNFQPNGYEGPSITHPKLIRESWSEKDSPPEIGFKQWTHNFDKFLIELTGDRVLIYRPLEGLSIYKKSGGRYISKNDVAGFLGRDDDVWVYQFGGASKREIYDSSGKIRRISRGAISQDFEYNLEGQLISVKHSLGGSIEFDYLSGGRIRSVRFPDGSELIYSYGNLNNIVGVDRTHGDEELYSQRYEYNDPIHLYALTDKIDRDGFSAQWLFDGFGRAIYSAHGEYEKVNLSYISDLEVETKNALGKVTKYNYSLVANAKRLESVEGYESPNCAAANKHYEYYDDGSVKSSTDWEGNLTTYQRDELGRETSRTEASGTPHARTIGTEYHPSFNKPSKINQGESITDYEYDAEGHLVRKIKTILNMGEAK